MFGPYLFVPNMFGTFLVMTTAQMSRTPTAYSNRTLWLTLLVVLLADALDLIDATVTNVAAPSVVRDLGGGATLVTWLGAAYSLALGSLLVLGGRLGDRYGQRRTMLIGMGGFVAASALAGAAADPVMLVAARAAQGAFGALMIPQGMAIMTRTFPRDALRKAFSAFGPMLGLFSVAGPIVAGFLIDADLFGLGWRPIFLINIVLGGGALLVARRVLPDVEPDRSTRIDAVGAALLIPALFSLLYGLITGSTDGWHVPSAALLTASGCAFAAFAARQARSSTPLITPSLFRSRGFVAGLLMGLLVFAAVNGLVYVISLFFQDGLHYSPARTSLGLLPLTIGIILAAGACMALIERLGRRLVLLGLLLSAAGVALLLRAVLVGGLAAPWWQLSAAILLIGAGAGSCFTCLFDTALGDVSAQEAGAASGSLSAVQQIAAGTGSALVTSVYFAAGGSVASVGSSEVHAVGESLGIVLAACALSLLAVPLLPHHAAVLEH